VAGAYSKEELAGLYRRRVGIVYQICLMLLKNVPDAEDACQTVFRKVLEQSEPFRDPEHERAWLIATARNECRNQLKHWWRTRRAGEEALETIPWEAPEDGEVWQALLSLPERERTALYLHYYQGYSTEETAELMGTKPATLRTWLFRARGKLKQRLEAEGYGV
jgi:RNA polymerase sigma-70 factor (ECF subfamily)